MTVFVDVDDDRAFPTEEEIAKARSDDDWNAQVYVVRHEDQHEEVTDGYLDHVKDGLQDMTPAPEAGLSSLVSLGKGGSRVLGYLRALIAYVYYATFQEGLSQHFQTFVQHRHQEYG